MDANVSTMTMPKTMPVQNLLRYISFKNKFSDPLTLLMMKTKNVKKWQVPPCDPC